MNVLCLGARIVGAALAEELVRAFLGAEFSRAERHMRRTGKIKKIEQGGLSA
jgi:ribose 5-phosphate isomerase B